jgi:hypothetical protein
MPQNPTEYGTSPVGRIISGDPWTKQTTDANNRPIPDAKQNYWFAVAIEKNAPGVDDMLATMWKAAMAGYQHVPNVAAQVQMGLAAPQFSWKVDDGDEMLANRTTGAQELRWKHGAGCWIFKFSTTLPIRPAKYQGNVPVDCDRSEIKRGYYVQIAYSTTANGNTDHTAGVYLNPQTVCLVAYGEEIVGGPSLEQQFGSGPGGYMPSGASQTPLAPTAAQPMQPAAQPMQPAAQPMQPAAQPMQPAAQPPAAGNSGMPTPAGNGQPMATGSPTSPPAAPYGGYMQPTAPEQAAPPATGGGMPGM